MSTRRKKNIPCIWLTQTWLGRVRCGALFCRIHLLKGGGGGGDEEPNGGLVGVTLVSWSWQTTALPDWLWLTHTLGEVTVSQRGDSACSGESGKTSPSLRCTIAHLQLRLIEGEGRKGGEGELVCGWQPEKLFASQKVSTTVPCQPIKDVRLASQRLLKPYVQKNFSAGKTFQILSKSQRLWC